MQEHQSFCERFAKANSIAIDKTREAIKSNPVRSIASIGFAALVSASFAVSEENSCATADGCKAPAALAAGMGAATAGILITGGLYAAYLAKEIVSPSVER